jgi:formamidopyrimidine-DNA glycosylase
MPELPELEVVREVLQRRVIGQTITVVEVLPPGGTIVVRDLIHNGFEKTLTGATFGDLKRRGKFLIFSFGTPMSGVWLVINPKLTGRLQLSTPDEKKMPKTHVLFTLGNGTQLRYVDQKRMGQLYLTSQLETIPTFVGVGPELLDINLDDFKARLKPFLGEIKGVLTRGDFLAGIGNAYADEILWEARIYPYIKRPRLTPEEIERLYSRMRTTLLNSIEKARKEMGENIHLKSREFMAVHMKTGQPCPRCGTPISLIGANQRITNFCRTCQPGGLTKGIN